MGKIICESCGTIFSFDKAKDMSECPVCGASFDEEAEKDNSSNDEVLSFGEGVENPDLYFYDIDEEDEYENDDLRDVWCQCTSCRKVITIPYNQFDIVKSEYVRLKKNLNLTCKGCGKQFTNTVVPKRPDGWKELNQWVKDYTNMPKCPTCSSTKIRKISVTSKVASVAVWGVLSRKVHKQWHCDTCGSEW